MSEIINQDDQVPIPTPIDTPIGDEGRAIEASNVIEAASHIIAPGDAGEGGERMPRGSASDPTSSRAG